MSDEKDDRLHIGLDGGFNISKQAIWRTLVALSLMFTGGGTVATKLENMAMQRQVETTRQEIASNREEIANNKKETTDKLKKFESVIDDVVNFLMEEKAIQKSSAAKQRYQEQIERIRQRMKPISQDDLRANPFAPKESILTMGAK